MDEATRAGILIVADQVGVRVRQGRAGSVCGGDPGYESVHAGAAGRPVGEGAGYR